MTVSNQQLYEAISELENKVVHRIENVEDKVDKHDAYINQLTGKIVVITGLIGLIINWAWNAIINRG